MMTVHLKLSNSIPLVLLLAVAVEALSGWPSGGVIVTGSAVQFSRDTWDSSLANPNATGNYSITGFDITQKWPSQQVDGWKMSVNVTSDIPDSETMNTGNSTGQTFTGTSIFITGPESIQASFVDNQTALDDTTWKICVMVIPNGPQDDSQTTADNSTCGFVTSQCSTDLQTAYADKFAEDQNCYGTPPTTPSSCADAINTANFSVQQLPLDSVNGSEVFVTASGSHDRGNEDAWENAIKQVWPVLTIWGWNIRAKAPSDAMPTTQLSCVRANYVEPGSKSQKSAGSTTRGSAIIVLTIVSLFADILL
ncbi:hypothetical protein F5Y15DRAFT_204825 [Xylariaceae sp. FL0016]|nr:hypothetical protein F5Y15DRAFT_204825 [Xylariaceae sp. FL0016]